MEATLDARCFYFVSRLLVPVLAWGPLEATLDAAASSGMPSTITTRFPVASRHTFAGTYPSADAAKLSLKTTGTTSVRTRTRFLSLGCSKPVSEPVHADGSGPPPPSSPHPWRPGAGSIGEWPAACHEKRQGQT
eukprot:CAMPEP_0170167214 /NCGR_PEP_ID=MMETSP0040_2-20121228/688_2 /TAXON_ID=641309 /ORGANISM="Lotharella oceanica, Strain CCMP622" /LENGTH=133 /DNA_ID=CAMNT_0010405173 /DNA_START=715 /DNA_END=1117 /DNA_ORIENTATION=-